MAVPANDYRERWSPLWEDPQDVASSAAPSILSPAQVQQWKDEGWLVVTGIWPDALIEEARQACEAAWPDGAEGPARRFPFAEETHAMNRVTMCPRYHSVARQLSTILHSSATTHIRSTQPLRWSSRTGRVTASVSPVRTGW